MQKGVWSFYVKKEKSRFGKSGTGRKTEIRNCRGAWPPGSGGIGRLEVSFSKGNRTYRRSDDQEEKREERKSLLKGWFLYIIQGIGNFR